MNIIGILGLLLSMALLIYFAYRGHSIVVVAPLIGLLALLLDRGTGAHVMAMYTETYMGAFASFVRNNFPLFLTGAIFAKLMDSFAYTTSIAAFVAQKLGPARCMLSVVLAGVVLTYSGVSAFVVAFVLYPIAVSLFRQSNIPKRLIPGCIALGAFTFTMTALPGTPQITNAIPMAYFGTDGFAAPLLGLIASVVMFTLGMLWLEQRSKRARAAGEGYGQHEDKVSTVNLEDRSSLPSIYIALFPVLSILGMNLLFSKLIFPHMDSSYLAEFGTDLSKVVGNWSVISALVCTAVIMALLNRKQLKTQSLATLVKEGGQAGFIPLIKTSAASGFGGLIEPLASFGLIQGFLFGLSGNALVAETLSINLLCGLTGSASGGLGATLEALAPTLIALAEEQNIPLTVMHRVAAISAGGLDTMPFNGAVLATVSLCGLSLKESYLDIFIVSLVIPLIATAVIILCAGFGLRC